MVNLYATIYRCAEDMNFCQKLLKTKFFSLKFKRLICLIEKFSLSLCPYIDNSF